MSVERKKMSILDFFGDIIPGIMSVVSFLYLVYINRKHK